MCLSKMVYKNKFIDITNHTGIPDQTGLDRIIIIIVGWESESFRRLKKIIQYTSRIIAFLTNEGVFMTVDLSR